MAARAPADRWQRLTAPGGDRAARSSTTTRLRRSDRCAPATWRAPAFADDRTSSNCREISSSLPIELTRGGLREVQAGWESVFLSYRIDCRTNSAVDRKFCILIMSRSGHVPSRQGAESGKPNATSSTGAESAEPENILELLAGGGDPVGPGVRAGNIEAVPDFA